MRTVDSQIRASRRELELRRRFLAGLVGLRSCLRADALGVRGEAVFAAAAPDERAARLERSIAEVEAQIVQARTAVQEAAETLARHELAAARRARAWRRHAAAPG